VLAAAAAFAAEPRYTVLDGRHAVALAEQCSRANGNA
jgi:hypothetical protein